MTEVSTSPTAQDPGSHLHNVATLSVITTRISGGTDQTLGGIMSNHDQPTCRGTRRDGEPCQSTLIGEDGFCSAHREGGSEEMRRRGKKGGAATASRFREGFTSDELPELESPQDAERWLEILSKAVVQGRISQSKANLARKSLKVWLKAHEAGKLADRFDRLEDALKEARRQGNMRPLLEVVEGELS